MRGGGKLEKGPIANPQSRLVAKHGTAQIDLPELNMTDLVGLTSLQALYSNASKIMSLNGTAVTGNVQIGVYTP